MNKVYSRINWENEPSTKTPLNEHNLNKIDFAVDEIDNRVIELDSTKAKNTDLQTLSTRVDNLILNAGDSSAECTDARVTEDGTTYDTLKKRLDAEHSSVIEDISQLSDEINYNGLNLPTNLAIDTVSGKYCSPYGVEDNTDSVVYKIKIESNTKYVLGVPDKMSQDYIIVKSSEDNVNLQIICFDDLETFEISRTTFASGFVFETIDDNRTLYLYVNRKLADFWQRNVYVAKYTDYIGIRDYADNLNKRVKNVEINLNNSYSSLQGKVWGAIGDSLTDITVEPSIKYGEMIEKICGCDFRNYGKAGHGYISGNYYFTEMAKVFESDCDIITIFGSINDMGQTVGTVADSDRTTLAGCINETITNVFDRKSTVKLGIISPLPNKNYYGKNDNNLEKIVNILKDICENRGVPFLDLYHNGGLMTNHNGFASAYMSDETHLNENGQEYISNKIKTFVESL